MKDIPGAIVGYISLDFLFCMKLLRKRDKLLSGCLKVSLFLLDCADTSKSDDMGF